MKVRHNTMQCHRVRYLNSAMEWCAGCDHLLSKQHCTSHWQRISVSTGLGCEIISLSLTEGLWEWFSSSCFPSSFFFIFFVFLTKSLVVANFFFFFLGMWYIKQLRQLPRIYILHFWVTEKFFNMKTMTNWSTLSKLMSLVFLISHRLSVAFLLLQRFF